MSILRHYMSKHTSRKSSILTIVIVATAALTLLAYASLTYSASAAKSGSSEKRGFKNLAACELSTANGHWGQLTENEVMNCYLHSFSGSPISSLSVIGHNDSSPNRAASGDTNGTNTVSTNLIHSGSSGSHTVHHHHHASSPNNTKSSVVNSNIGQ